MAEIISLLRRCDDLVGVIDLKAGQAVHAVAGQRDRYRPISRRFIDDGSPRDLIDYYGSLGLRRFYLADLDAICDGKHQWGVIERLLETDYEEFLLDLGWTGDQSISNVLCRFSRAKVVAATETMKSVSALERLCEQVECSRIVMGLDYREGALQGSGVSEDEWQNACRDLGIVRFLPLEITSVGTDRGPRCGDVCQRIRAENPNAIIYSGGGIRDLSDVERLEASGCNRYLVASALFRRTD